MQEVQKLKVTIIFLLMSLTSFSQARSGDEFLPTVAEVSLEKYVGQWYAITTLPQFFTRKCVAQEAIYKMNAANEIGVTNICTKKNGRKKDIKGYARTTSVPGVLDLKFTSGFAGLFGAKGDYNIIALDSEYRYALIGGQDRESLWLLSRTKEVSDDVYAKYIGIADELGFDTTQLIDSHF